MIKLINFKKKAIFCLGLKKIVIKLEIFIQQYQFQYYAHKSFVPTYFKPICEIRYKPAQFRKHMRNPICSQTFDKFLVTLLYRVIQNFSQKFLNQCWIVSLLNLVIHYEHDLQIENRSKIQKLALKIVRNFCSSSNICLILR